MKHLAPTLGTLFALASCSGSPAETRTSTAPPHAARTAWHPRSGPSMDQLLNVHRAFAPTATDDGARVGFLSDAPGVPQGFAATVGASAVPEAQWERLTRVDDRVHFVDFAPGGRALFFGRDHGGDENVQLFRAAPDGGNAVDLTHAPRVKHMFGAISRDGALIAYASNARDPGSFDLYVQPSDAGEPRRVMETHGHFEAEDFAPGAQKLVVREERSNFDGDVHLIDLASGAHTQLTAHQGDVRYEYPRFSRDGRSLFVLSDQGREYMNLALLPIAGGEVSFVLDEPHDVDQLAASPTTDTLALAVNVDGWHELRLYDASDPRHPRALTAVQLPRVVVSAMSFSHDGRYLVVGAGRAAMPDEIYRVEVATGRATRVTESDRAGIANDALVEPTVEHVPSYDGLSVPVFLYRPRAMAQGERAPVVVLVHGGPEAQAQPRFNPVTQFLVGHGYIVAEPNVRGSTGYGKRYSRLDDVARREDSVHDLAEVNRWLRARADVDPSRIAVMGGSYGGYMTLAAITLYPDLWAAACDIVGIANFRTFLENTAAYRRALREAEYGSLAHDGELLDRISPLHRVDQIRAPLFVIHGTNDPRVPVGEAEQIVNALRARGQRVEYLRFENEGHGLARRENKIRAYGAVAQFFDSVMGGT